MVHEVDKIIPESVDVEQAKRLGVVAKRIPGPGLKHLIERADAAGKADEAIAKLGHLCLALMHVGDGDEIGQAGMRDLMIDQRLRNDAVYLAAGLQHRIGDYAHEAEAPAAIDHVDAA